MFFQFSESQSSAIATVGVNGQYVAISFHSNPDKVYSFVTEDENQIVEFLQNPGDQSIGQMYHRWVSENVLIPVEELAAV